MLLLAPFGRSAAITYSLGSISAVSRVRSLILPEEGMSRGSFSRTAAGNRAYVYVFINLTRIIFFSIVLQGLTEYHSL